MELKNLASGPEYSRALAEMRKKYDKELALWKKRE